MRNEKVKEMAIYSLFTAIIVILASTPLGFIRVGVVSVTIIPIFVIIMAFLLGVKGGLEGGVTFGIVSMIVAFTLGPTGLDALFRNPLVSVLPRVIFGLVAGIIGDLLNKKYGNELGKKTVLMVIASVLLSLLHTALVLPMMYLFIPTVQEFEKFWDETPFLIYFWATLVSNGFIEMALTGAVVPVCSVPLKKVLERN